MIRHGAAQSLTAQAKEFRDSQGMQEADIALVLAERDNMRRANQLDRSSNADWKSYTGANPALFEAWKTQMLRLAELIQEVIDADRVPVSSFIRLRSGNGAVHEDTIRRLAHARLGEELPWELIDRSATPQQWVALTRHPDFEPGVGLPADPNRRIRVKQQWLDATGELDFFTIGAASIAVRGGFAELGSSFHHARVYRCTKTLKSGKTGNFFAMMRVYQVDLLERRGEAVDLFAAEIAPQTMSHRRAEPRLREALERGDAEYVGWIVPGDELFLDMGSQIGNGAVGGLLEQFPGTMRWTVDGFFDVSKLRLRPRMMAGEGVSRDTEGSSGGNQVLVTPETEKLISTVGWRPSVDIVFGACHAKVIRRDILGRPRLQSSANLPVCWPSDGEVSAVFSHGHVVASDGVMVDSVTGEIIGSEE